MYTIWLMPIHPSPYQNGFSVIDCFGMNPDYCDYRCEPIGWYAGLKGALLSANNWSIPALWYRVPRILHWEPFVFNIWYGEILINDEACNQAGLPRSGLSEHKREEWIRASLGHACEESNQLNHHWITKIIWWWFLLQSSYTILQYYNSSVSILRWIV